MPKDKAPETAGATNDEGEPQTTFFHPQEGGAYTRNDDGSLTRTEGPTKVPDTAPTTE